MTETLGWSELLWLPDGVPLPLIFLLGMILFFAVFLFPLSFFLGFAERKLIADLQARVGPNRAGTHGLLQAPADLIKELSRAPALQDSNRRQFWYLIFIGTLYSSLGVLPLGPDLIALDSEISALLPLLSFSLSMLAFSLVGLESYHYEAMLASLRRGYQHFSALVPAFVSVVTVGVVAESLEWRRIGEVQDGGVFSALIFQQPLLFLSFIVFQLSGMVIFAVSPFQTMRRSAEIIEGEDGASGFHQFYAFFAWCILSVVLFLGAWDVFGLEEPGAFRTLLSLSSILLKASVLFLVSRVLSKAFPELRLDQITEFSWKVLCPLAIGTFALCALMKTLGAQL